MSNSLAHHHILWRNHWEIIIFGLKCLKYHTGIKYHYRLRGGKWQLNYVREGGLFSEWWWIQTYFPGLQKECSQEWRAETWVGMLMESFPELGAWLSTALELLGAGGSAPAAEVRGDSRWGPGSHPHWGVSGRCRTDSRILWLRGHTLKSLGWGICWGHLYNKNRKCASVRGKGNWCVCHCYSFNCL